MLDVAGLGPELQAMHRGVDPVGADDHVHQAGLSELAESGEHERISTIAASAEHVARKIISPTTQALVLTHLAKQLVNVGQLDRGNAMADEAARALHATTAPSLQVRTFTELAKALVATGESGRARAAIKHAERTAATIALPQVRVKALATLVSQDPFDFTVMTASPQATALPSSE